MKKVISNKEKLQQLQKEYEELWAMYVEAHPWDRHKLFVQVEDLAVRIREFKNVKQNNKLSIRQGQK